MIRIKNVFRTLIIAVLFVPIIINASEKYENAKNKSNVYMDGFSKNERYIMYPPSEYYFDFWNNNSNVEQGFTRGGFINREEYLITSAKNKISYIFNGIEYWTLTNTPNGGKYVVSNEDKRIDKNDGISNIKITEFVLPNAKITGKGTFIKPWVFSSKYNVILDKQYGSGGTESFEIISNSALPDDIVFPSRIGFTFEGYYNKPKNENNNYIQYYNSSGPIANMKIENDTILYAHWDPLKYNVKYNANGGSGSMPSSLFEYGKYEQLRKNTFEKEGYYFNGWATSSDGDIEYNDEALVSSLGSEEGEIVTLYAIWVPTVLANEVVLEKNSPGCYTYSIPADGYYKLETWGASGGGQLGAAGGYSVGAIYLQKNDQLNYCTGGYGEDDDLPAWNGGGTRAGGATHISKGIDRGELFNYEQHRNDVLIVSGGGGYGYQNAAGEGWIFDGVPVTPLPEQFPGGSGGGNTGGGDSPGTQSSGHAFGKGKNTDAGGGWYGGAGRSGGSGFIGNSSLISIGNIMKSMYCYNCANSYDENTYTVNTKVSHPLNDTLNCDKGFSYNNISKCPKNGNGNIKITYLYATEPPAETITSGTKEYAFEGSEKKLIIGKTGYYKLEVWGAGKSNNNDSPTGGYSTGVVRLNANEEIFINVGGSSLVSGYNGGSLYSGGATHIAKGAGRGALANYDSHREEVLIVAAGGGSGQAAGGYIGLGDYGATQSSGYSFGQGNPGSCYHCAGGGGWYGGGYTCGGSSYIGNPLLISSGSEKKSMFCLGCKESYEDDTFTIKSKGSSQFYMNASGCPNGYSTSAISKCAKVGEGYAKITYLYATEPPAETITSGTKEYAFEGSEKKLIIGKAGYYKLEVWGAGSSNNTDGQKGGYATGVVRLNNNDELYINVGGSKEVFGYNGGATNAGGATHIAKGTGRGALSNYDSHREEVLIVAGGAGNSGAGGGYYSVGLENYAATQSSGNAFGRSSIGGGGWYGGVAYGGGTGYIGNPLLISSGSEKKAMFCLGCRESYEDSTFTLKTKGGSQFYMNTSGCPNGYSTSAVSKCAKVGNGYAKITYLYEAEPPVETITSGTKEYAFEGREKKLKIGKAGYYKLEVWGAGKANGTDARKGGYSTGVVRLNNNDELYINVGGSSDTFGYNGGATGAGGATHIAKGTGRGALANYDGHREEVLIVAAGAGADGDGGGYKGVGSGAGTQTTGYAFGKSASGGGGWYGGNGAVGGSGYIGNPLLISSVNQIKSMFCMNCAESDEGDIFTIKTKGNSPLRDTTNCKDGYSTTAVSKCAKVGNGYARITYLYEEIPTDDVITTGTKEYTFEGKEKTLRIGKAGYYKLEVWGAQGGNITTGSYKKDGGYGGYSSGIINLNKNQILYINIGGQGENGVNGTIKTLAGGYNGGGNGYIHRTGSGTVASGGGGATHIAIRSGLLRNLSNNLSSILIVAGGGGGTHADTDSNGYNSIGGSGGGMIGKFATQDRTSCASNCKSYDAPEGGSQSSGGSGVTNWQNGTINQTQCIGEFGQGAACTSNSYGGGGGGYYGGGSGIYNGGGGGSGYIGNSSLTDKSMYCYDCTESGVSSTLTVKTNGTSSLRDTANCPNGYNTNAISKCAKSGAGYARITYLHN